MSPIHGVDNQSVFFPIKQDKPLASPIGADNQEGVNSAISENQSHFQSVLQALLDKYMANRQDLSGITGLNGSELNAFQGISDGEGDSGLISSQSGSIQLLRSLLEMAKDETNGGNRHGVEIPYNRMITKYKQAMNDFRNAFHLLPAGTPDGLSIHTIQRILNGETGIINNISAQPCTPGTNPTRQEVTDYITDQCRIIGIPAELGLATASTESDLIQFGKDGMPVCGSNSDSADWGIMQINDKAWGDTFDFNRIKSDWKYNVRAGLQILKESYNAAIRSNEDSKGANSSLENLARAAYSGYNAGTGNIWRYRTAVDDAPKTGPYDVINNEGYDIRDIRFWKNYQKYA